MEQTNTEIQDVIINWGEEEDFVIIPSDENTTSAKNAPKVTKASKGIWSSLYSSFFQERKKDSEEIKEYYFEGAGEISSETNKKITRMYNNTKILELATQQGFCTPCLRIEEDLKYEIFDSRLVLGLPGHRIQKGEVINASLGINLANKEEPVFMRLTGPNKDARKKGLKGDSPSFAAGIKQEIAILNLFKDNERFLQFSYSNSYHSKKGDRKEAIVVKFTNQGNLETFLEEDLDETENQKKLTQFIYDILCALRDMDENNVYHRDLNPSNIYLHDGRVKIGGFRFAVNGNDHKEVEDLSAKNQPIKLYMSPECLKRENLLSKKNDLWALAQIIYRILNEHVLCDPMGFPQDFAKQIDQISQEKITEQCQDGEDLDKFQRKMHKFLRYIMIKDQEKRPTVQEALEQYCKLFKIKT
jgi:serine/threonine protein kinase